MHLGETKLSGAPPAEPCDICGGTSFPLQVCQSGGGYYVGTQCAGCGAPESRETGYYRKRTDAETELARIKAGDLSNTRAVEAGLTPFVAKLADS